MSITIGCTYLSSKRGGWELVKVVAIRGNLIRVRDENGNKYYTVAARLIKA